MSGTPAFGDLRDRFDVGDRAAGIGNGFDEDRLGLVGNGILEAGNVVDVGPHDVPAEFFVGLAELVDGSAIELACGDELITRRQQRMEDEVLGRVAGGDRKRRRAAFQRRDALFQHRAGWVADARVDIAEGLQAEQRRGMVDIVEDEGCCLVDWRRARACGRVGLRAGVDRQCRKAGFAGLAHDYFPPGNAPLGRFLSFVMKIPKDL